MKAIPLILFLLLTTLHADEITPDGDRPDFQAILSQADNDTAAHRYEDALAKYAWLQKSISHLAPLYNGPSYYHGMIALSRRYPAAKEKLREAGRDAEAVVRNHPGEVCTSSFLEAEAINRELGQEGRTVELFRWLDEYSPKQARHLALFVMTGLVRAKDYKLWGKYVEPQSDFDGMVAVLRSNLRGEEGHNIEAVNSFGRKNFTIQVTGLVATLAVNNRKSEAEEFAGKAAKEWDSPVFKEQLDQALKGILPLPAH